MPAPAAHHDPDPRLLAERAEEAVRDGGALLRWRRAADLSVRFFPLDLARQVRLPYEAQAYFAEAPIGGTAVPVMGCRQRILLDSRSPAAPADVTDFMMTRFLEAVYWRSESGGPSGFSVTPSLFHIPAAGASSPTAPFDWRRLGRDWTWAVLRIDIHDFVMEFGPLRRRVKQAALVAPSAEFVAIEEHEGSARVSVGYPFVRIAPLRNYFGFGPGKFTTAIKTYTMSLEPGGALWMEMDFAAAPRCEKVLDFGERWPDPVYGAARLAERASFGLWRAAPLRDRLDAAMLAQHARVHHAVIEGVERDWRLWLAGRPSLAPAPTGNSNRVRHAVS